jgi:hypothetical protein
LALGETGRNIPAPGSRRRPRLVISFEHPIQSKASSHNLHTAQSRASSGSRQRLHALCERRMHASALTPCATRRHSCPCAMDVCPPHILRACVHIYEEASLLRVAFQWSFLLWLRWHTIKKSARYHDPVANFISHSKITDQKTRRAASPGRSSIAASNEECPSLRSDCRDSRLSFAMVQ